MFGGREPASTIKFVDDYCQWYRKLFSEVRSFEAYSNPKSLSDWITVQLYAILDYDKKNE
jgi:hypothetical protein